MPKRALVKGHGLGSANERAAVQIGERKRKDHVAAYSCHVHLQRAGEVAGRVRCRRGKLPNEHPCTRACVECGTDKVRKLGLAASLVQHKDHPGHVERHLREREEDVMPVASQAAIEIVGFILARELVDALAGGNGATQLAID
eukprot:scaffold119918_cov69-Phaeocystis_antarctica.AAC.4